MTRANLESDLAFVREVVEMGRTRTYIGGGDLVVFGGLTALAFASHWAIGALSLSPNLYPILWIAYGIEMALVGNVRRKKVQGVPGSGSFSNQVDGFVWVAATFAIMAIVIGIIAQMILTKDASVVNWILPASFALYGVAFMTTGKVSGERILVSAAIVQFASACGFAAIVNHPALYLFASLAVLIGMVIPGMMLVRRAPPSVG